MNSSRDLTDKELRQEIYKLRRELRADMQDIRQALKSERNLPDYALRDFREAEKSMREKSVSKQDRKELQSTYRNLQYIRGLKSSKAENLQDVYNKVTKRIDDVSKINNADLNYFLQHADKDVVKMFWDIYKGTFEGASGIRENFKYELFGTIVDYIESGGLNEKYFALVVEALYRDTQLDSDGGFNSDADIQFTEELRKLFSDFE